MKAIVLASVVAGTLIPGVLLAQGAAAAAAPVPVTTPAPDCTKLKGKARKDCVASVAEAAAQKPAVDGTADRFPFPEASSKAGGELPKATEDMPTSNVPLPPAESLKPLGSLPPDGAGGGSSSSSDGGSSSSSSSSSGAGAVPDAGDDDAAPTTAGGDTPVRAADLKDLGSRGDTSKAREALELTRVEDDLRVGHFYFRDGDYKGATARYQDALTHDPDSADAHFGLAEVLLKQNKRAEAAVHLQRYLELAPDDDHTKDARKMLAKLH